jgi:hypothetical protein
MDHSSELFNLLLSGIGLTIIFTTFRSMTFPGFHALCLGYTTLCAANLFTVVEGICWFAVFNLLEHAAYALAGVCFLYGCLESLGATKRTERIEKTSR